MNTAAVILEPVTFAAELKADVIAAVRAELIRITGMVVEKPMNTKEAAAFLNVHPDTLRRYVRQGKIKPHRLGQNPIFYPSELNAQIKAMKS